jgi:hypothetical protein
MDHSKVKINKRKFDVGRDELAKTKHNEAIAKHVKTDIDAKAHFEATKRIADMIKDPSKRDDYLTQMDVYASKQDPLAEPENESDYEWLEDGKATLAQCLEIARNLDKVKNMLKNVNFETWDAKMEDMTEEQYHGLLAQTLGFQINEKSKRDLEQMRIKAKVILKGGYKHTQYVELHPYVQSRSPEEIRNKPEGEKLEWEKEVQNLVSVAGRSEHGSDLGKGLLLGARDATTSEIDYMASVFIEKEIMQRCKGRDAGKRLIESEKLNCVDGANYRIFEKIENTWDYPAVVSWFTHAAQILGSRTNLSTHSMILRQVPACVGAQGGNRTMICLVTIKGTDWVNENGICRGFGYYAV